MEEKRARRYNASIKRNEYERIASKVQYHRDILPFDTFVIDLGELYAFVPVIHSNMNKETVLKYMHKVSHQEINFDEFNQMVL